jgi:D-glycero-D-manno-heptose 1,7-bisphosphate phosphatase
MTNSTASPPAIPLPARQVLRTVFLDRDGVINRKLPEGEYCSSLDRFQLLPGTLTAIAALKAAGLRVVVVTNQRGIALGRYTAEAVDIIHAHLQSQLSAFGASVDAFYFCPHDKNACICRKPGPGMFQQALADFPAITPASSVMIGDSFSDIEFGARLSIATIFLEGDIRHRKPGAEKAMAIATTVAADLPAAVALLLGN